MLILSIDNLCLKDINEGTADAKQILLAAERMKSEILDFLPSPPFKKKEREHGLEDRESI